MAYLFNQQPPHCPFKLVHRLQVEHDGEKIILDCQFGLLFNLTTPKKINHPGCLMFSIYGTTLEEVFISLDPQAHMLLSVQAMDLRESEHLLPALPYMAHQNSELIRNVQLEQNVGSCEAWLHIKNEHDYLQPVIRKAGLFVRRMGMAIYEYQCGKYP